jgi:hypothetical protein
LRQGRRECDTAGEHQRRGREGGDEEGTAHALRASCDFAWSVLLMLERRDRDGKVALQRTTVLPIKRIDRCVATCGGTLLNTSAMAWPAESARTRGQYAANMS